MDELLKHVSGVMNTNAAMRARWNRMSENEKKSLAVGWYRRQRMKNWNHLPAEIKLECIKTLDFKARLRLRTTARQERELVDSLTIDFPLVLFSDPKAPLWDHPRRNPHRSSGTAYVEYPLRSHNAYMTIDIVNHKKYMSAIHLLAYALKIGKIDKLDILETYSPKRFDHCAKKILAKSAPFRVKNLEVVASKAAVLMFLKNLEPSMVESIRLDAQESSKFPIDEILTFPAVTSCKLLQIRRLTCLEHAVKIVEKWIELDSAVGTKLQASVKTCGAKIVSKFEDIFADRIEWHQEKQVRLRTDNATKHVLLKWIERVEGHFDRHDYISCTIIPSDFVVDSEEDEDVRWTASCDSIGRASQYHVDSMWEPQWYESAFESAPDPLFDELLEKFAALIGADGREDESD